MLVESRPTTTDIVRTTDWVPGLENDPDFRPGKVGQVVAVMLHRPTAIVQFFGAPGVWHVPFDRLALDPF
jgi:hypothetical protein